jgi:hypothetical protein
VKGFELQEGKKRQIEKSKSQVHTFCETPYDPSWVKGTKASVNLGDDGFLT